MINFVHAGQLDGIDQFRLRLGTMEIGYTWPTPTLQKYLTGGILGVYGLDVEADAFKEFTDTLCTDWPSLAFDKDRTRDHRCTHRCQEAPLEAKPLQTINTTLAQW